MREQVERRLEELRSEFEAGQALLADLESRQAQVRSSMLRISGAAQVLEELLNEKSALERSVEAASAV